MEEWFTSGSSPLLELSLAFSIFRFSLSLSYHKLNPPCSISTCRYNKPVPIDLESKRIEIHGSWPNIDLPIKHRLGELRAYVGIEKSRNYPGNQPKMRNKLLLCPRIEADPCLTSEQDTLSTPFLLSQPRHIVADYYHTWGEEKSLESSDCCWRFIGRCIGRFEKWAVVMEEEREQVWSIGFAR